MDHAEDYHTDLIKVSGTSNVNKVAHSIFHALGDYEEVTVRAMGVPAVNQAAKAIAIARGLVAPRAEDLWARIGFTTIKDEGKEMSAVVFLVTTK